MKQKCIAQLFRRGIGIGLSFAMTLTMLPSIELKAEITEAGIKKETAAEAGSIGASAGAVTQGQPFVPGTGGSENFGSPALIVRKAKLGADDTKSAGGHDWLIAAAEAKYDSTEENRGQGIILSVSEDGGANWNYSFPMHFADSSASFSNPVLVDEETVGGNAANPVVTGGKIYCFASAYPAGVSVEEESTYPKPGTGYVTVDGEKYLALTADTAKTEINPAGDTAGYEYYVSRTKGADQLYPVLNRSDHAASAYAIDAWYNLYKKESGSGYEPLMKDGGSVQQNVFYTGAALSVYKASYIMYVTSDDDGESWSDPQILNPEIYNDENEVLALSSGKGLRTSAGRIVVPVDNKPEFSDDSARASIFWKCLEEGHPWHRSGDIRSEKEGVSGETEEKWTASGEIVEVSDGHLRMFFQNSESTVQYADASRDEDNMFVFGDVVSTGTSVTPKAEISAFKYSKTVNGQPAIMLAMPTGSGFTNGMIDTFTPGQGDSSPIQRVDGYEVGSANFSAACMDEMAYGSKIGLIWEDGMGSIRFESYDTLDVAQNSFIPGLEINLDMYVGETYERTYSGVNAEYVHPAGEDPAPDREDIIDFAFQRGEETKAEVPALYSRSQNDSGSLANVYQADADISADITKAEFTFKRVTNTDPDLYIIYSEGEQRYFTYSDSKDAMFTTTGRNNMRVTAKGEGNFTIQNSDSEQKQLHFNTDAKRFDGGDSSSADENVRLLKKLNDAELANVSEADQLIPGYQAATEIESGRRYLIAHAVSGEAGSKFAENAMVILYPRNSLKNSSKLVYGTRQATVSAQKTVRIQAIGEGSCSIAVNGITYHIKARNAEISVPQGGQTFVRTQNAEITAAPNPDVADAKAGTRVVKGLFDRNPDTINDTDIDITDAYETTRDTDLNMSRAEFVITKKSGTDYYTIYNQYTKSYLMNLNANSALLGHGSFFGIDKTTHELKAQQNGEETLFQIVRNGNPDGNGNRLVYFNRSQMRFDGLHGWNYANESVWKERGTAELEFLKKKDFPANDDPIPGYERVDEITDGTYLITHYEHYTNPETQSRESAIIILYADNGLANMSKIYRDVEENGVWVTAKGQTGDTAKMTVGGIPYTVTVGETCNHEGADLELRNVLPTCQRAGRSGDIYCANCQALVREGEEIAKLPHTPGEEWKVTTERTVTQDGEKKRLCAVCGEICEGEGNVERIPRTVEYVKEELRKKIEEIKGKNYSESDYTANSYQIFTDALQTAEGLVNAAETTVAAVAGAYTALEAAVAGLERQRQITVTFDANGGTFGDDGTTKSVTTTNHVDKPDDPTREDYTFAGWFIGQTDGTKVVFDANGQWQVTSQGDITLYAYWTENPEITLNPNPLEVKAGSAAALFVGGVPEGKTVTWSVDPAGAVTVENAESGNAQVTVRAAAAAGTNAVLTASAEGAKKATVTVNITNTEVTFDANQGVFENGEKTKKNYKDGEGKVAKPEPGPTREGYTFAGWFTGREEGSEVKFEGGKWTVPGSDDVTLYARWTENPVTPPDPAKVKVTFDANGGAFAGGATLEAPVADGKVERPANPEREGYTFAGWFTGKADGTEVAFEADGTWEVSGTDNVTLYAHWNPNEVAPPVSGDPGQNPGQDPGQNPGQDPVPPVFKTGAEQTVGGITYRVLNAGKKTAVVKKGVNKRKVAIPAKVAICGVSCKVVQIGSKAFKGYKKLQQIAIGKNVTTITKNAFQNCAKLKTVTLQKGTKLKTVKSGAFKKTSAKLTVKVPKAIKKSKTKKNKLLKVLRKGGNKKVKIK